MPDIEAKAFSPVSAGIDPSESMIQGYTEALKNAAPKLYARLLESVPDWKTFQSKIADVSNQGIKNMFDASFVSRSERTASNIVNIHLDKLKESYQKWLTKLAYQFETVDGVEAKRYKDQIDNTAEFWAQGVIRSTLRFTGDKVRGRGVAPWAGYFLTGDNRTVGMMPPGAQILKGGATNIVRTGLRTAFKSGRVQKLIQAGMIISTEKYDSATVLEQNTAINDFIKGLQSATFVDFQPTVDQAKSYCLYIVDGSNMRLEIQVVTP